MSAKTYSEQSGSVRNAYCAGHELVLQFGCSLPDVCVACGGPARSNVEKKEFEPTGWWLLPSPVDFIRLWFGTSYVFQFPFCSNCEPKNFPLKPVRLDSRLAVFTGAPNRLLDSLPPIPPDIQAEKDLSWLQRKFSWLHNCCTERYRCRKSVMQYWEQLYR